MKELKAIIAATNDEYDLKSRSTIQLFYNWLSSDDTIDNGLNGVVEYLNEVSKNSDHPYQEVSQKVLNRINEVDFNDYLQYLEDINDSGISFLPFYSVLYPKQLWKIDHPPLGLYVDGNTSTLFGGIAIVGTRDATEHRKEFARELAKSLAEEGYPIISGLANGIDTMAHIGAIEGGGRTIAVLPGGVQTIRPSSNKDLAKKIPENGALIAELSDYTNIHRGRFVERNRIISGISIAVVVAASKETGGTIRQGEFAQEQSRPRFMYDPEIDDGQSPTKLVKLGFSRIKSEEELKEFLSSEWEEPQNQEPLSDYV